MTTLETAQHAPQSQTRTSHQLTSEEVKSFHDNGCLGPFQLCSPEEMEIIREKVIREVYDATETDQNENKEKTFVGSRGAKQGKLGTQYRSTHPRQGQSRHLDNRTVFNLCSHPSIIERMASLMGPDLMIWRSNFFNKEPGGAEIPWHQDLNYWPLEPAINLSAWLALDPVTVENSCVQLIPGSHKSVLPHIMAKEGMAFQEMADPKSYDASKAINMELKPGEFFLFTEKLLHHSEPNRSDKRRLGLAVRVTVPWVYVDSPKVCLNHYNIMLRGEDRFGFNKMGSAPA